MAFSTSINTLQADIGHTYVLLWDICSNVNIEDIFIDWKKYKNGHNMFEFMNIVLSAW